MESLEIAVSTREATGKGGARKLRRDGRVPGILYSKQENLALTVDLGEFNKLLRRASAGNALLDVNVEGGKQVKALIKEIQRDPIFGPVMMFGLGGIFVEILEDVAFRAIPLSRHDARSMVEQIKARKILEGARGEPAVDKEALVDLLLKVSSMVTAYPALAELDLNPILAYDDGYAVVDARVIVNWAV